MSGPALTVFAPSPLLTITVEAPGSDRPEIHLHAGGQGIWVARMAALLGADVTLCCALGGEPGVVLRALIAEEGVKLVAVECSAWNGVYVHARRDGVRSEFARTHCVGLSRHESDELYGAALSAAIDSRVAMLTGVDPPGAIEADVYRRLASDLRRNGVKVIADLSGEPLAAALAGGLDLLKVSDEELGHLGLSSSSGQSELIAALDTLHERGAESVLISRGERAAFALDGRGGCLELTGPHVEALEPAGTGDSMFAALGVSLAEGETLEVALRLAMAAGCLNATRRGLGTGSRAQIERLSRHVGIDRVATQTPRDGTPTRRGERAVGTR